MLAGALAIWIGSGLALLVGCHGGMGGPQSHPFVLAPAGLAPPGEVVGAEAMHRGFRSWLAGLGHRAYAEP
jgi:hypothetical protein